MKVICGKVYWLQLTRFFGDQECGMVIVQFEDDFLLGTDKIPGEVLAGSRLDEMV